MPESEAARSLVGKQHAIGDPHVFLERSKAAYGVDLRASLLRFNHRTEIGAGASLDFPPYAELVEPALREYALTYEALRWSLIDRMNEHERFCRGTNGRELTAQEFGTWKGVVSQLRKRMANLPFSKAGRDFWDCTELVVAGFHRLALGYPLQQPCSSFLREAPHLRARVNRCSLVLAR